MFSRYALLHHRTMMHTLCSREEGQAAEWPQHECGDVAAMLLIPTDCELALMMGHCCVMTSSGRSVSDLICRGNPTFLQLALASTVRP